MSAGPFTTVSYVSEYDTAVIHKIRVQPETLALAINSVANTASTTLPNSPISAMVSKSKRGLGLHAATVTLKATGTTAPVAGYLVGSVVTVPLVNSAIRSAAKTAVAATAVTYLGVTTWKVVGYSEEKAK
jgi:hypothetical protein